MSLDKSLKKAGSLARARNVLSRAERLALLQEPCLTQEDPLALCGQAAGSMAHPVNWEAL